MLYSSHTSTYVYNSSGILFFFHLFLYHIPVISYNTVSHLWKLYSYTLIPVLCFFVWFQQQNINTIHCALRLADYRPIDLLSVAVNHRQGIEIRGFYNSGQFVK